MIASAPAPAPVGGRWCVVLFALVLVCVCVIGSDLSLSVSSRALVDALLRPSRSTPTSRDRHMHRQPPRDPARHGDADADGDPSSCSCHLRPTHPPLGEGQGQHQHQADSSSSSSTWLPCRLPEMPWIPDRESPAEPWLSFPDPEDQAEEEKKDGHAAGAGAGTRNHALPLPRSSQPFSPPHPLILCQYLPYVTPKALEQACKGARVDCDNHAKGEGEGEDGAPTSIPVPIPIPIPIPSWRHVAPLNLTSPDLLLTKQTILNHSNMFVGGPGSGSGPFGVFGVVYTGSVSGWDGAVSAWLLSSRDFARCGTACSPVGVLQLQLAHHRPVPAHRSQPQPLVPLLEHITPQQHKAQTVAQQDQILYTPPPPPPPPPPHQTQGSLPGSLSSSSSAPHPPECNLLRLSRWPDYARGEWYRDFNRTYRYYYKGYQSWCDRDFANLIRDPSVFPYPFDALNMSLGLNHTLTPRQQQQLALKQQQSTETPSTSTSQTATSPTSPPTPTKSPAPIPPYTAVLNGVGCLPGDFGCLWRSVSGVGVSRSVQYRWLPWSGCTIDEDWSPEAFCEWMFAGRLDLLMVGDSLMSQMFDSLTLQIEQRRQQLYQDMTRLRTVPYQLNFAHIDKQTPFCRIYLIHKQRLHIQQQQAQQQAQAQAHAQAANNSNSNSNSDSGLGPTPIPIHNTSVPSPPPPPPLPMFDFPGHELRWMELNEPIIQFDRNDQIDAQGLWVSILRGLVARRGSCSLPGSRVVLVLNAGAHNLPFATYRSNLIRTFTHLRDHFPRVIVIFRSTSTGHTRCRDRERAGPYPADAIPEDAHQSLYPEWGWDGFSWKDSEALAALEHVYGPMGATRYPVYFLDIQFAHAQRVDNHPPTECLHMCLPGEIDLWTAALVQLIKQILTQHIGIGTRTGTPTEP